MTLPDSKFNGALLLLIFALPSSFQLDPIAISFGSFSITLLEICVFALLTHWLCHVLVTRKGYRSPFDRWFFILFAYFFLALIVGSARFTAFKASADFRQFMPLFLYCWAMRFYGKATSLARFRPLIFNVLIVVAVYTLIAFLFFRGHLKGELEGSDTWSNRVFFDNTLFLLLAYGGYLVHRAALWKSGSRYVLLVLLSNALMLLVMQMRNYWVAFALVVALTVIWNRSLFFRLRVVVPTLYILAAIMLSAMLLLNVFPVGQAGAQKTIASIQERIQSVVSMKETLNQQRRSASADTDTIGTRMVTAMVIWKDYVTENPFFGTGFGGELPMVNEFGSLVTKKYQVDNGYLTLLAKFGAMGLALYGLLLWRICRLLYSITTSRFATEEETALARSFLIGIFAMLIASAFSSILIRQQAALVGFLFMLAEIEVMRRNIAFRQASSASCAESASYHVPSNSEAAAGLS